MDIKQQINHILDSLEIEAQPNGDMWIENRAAAKKALLALAEKHATQRAIEQLQDLLPSMDVEHYSYWVRGEIKDRLTKLEQSLEAGGDNDA